jgi:hypothetical protein
MPKGGGRLNKNSTGIPGNGGTPSEITRCLGDRQDQPKRQCSSRRQDKPPTQGEGPRSVPRRERAHAPADVDGAIETLRSAAAAHAQVQARPNSGSI